MAPITSNAAPTVKEMPYTTQSSESTHTTYTLRRNYDYYWYDTETHRHMGTYYDLNPNPTALRNNRAGLQGNRMLGYKGDTKMYEMHRGTSGKISPYEARRRRQAEAVGNPYR